ncbi:MAG: PHP domain-containing protein [Ruminococcaceae bacterium]|nr:PHP domain-containing protein [Oscillospiraceae bacterium]
MLTNYHTHTYRCNHASGTEEEYIERAISCGVQIMGFSDHAPIPFEAGYNTGWRVPKEKAQEYVDTINALKEKYKDKIELHVGFEMEYYPEYFDEMFAFVKSAGAEYLILGEHYLGKENDGRRSSAGPGHTGDSITEYVDLIIEGMKTGKFLYVAHPDILNYNGDDERWEREMTRLCEAAKKLQIPLEINCLGIRDNRTYSSEKFYKIAGQVGATMIIGFDAHDAMSACDNESLEKIKVLKEKYNLKIIESIEIKGL